MHFFEIQSGTFLCISGLRMYVCSSPKKNAAAYCEERKKKQRMSLKMGYRKIYKYIALM